MSQDVAVEAMHTALTFGRLLRPHRVEGPRKIRVGRIFDGGYVMLDAFDGIEAAYLLGINDEVSWDLDIAARGIPVIQFHHTIERLPAEHELFHWERIGIAHKADPERSLDTLTNVMSRNGHSLSREAGNLAAVGVTEGHGTPVGRRLTRRGQRMSMPS